jgi:glycosyltransferase involved in cell wall biosynthesis
MTVDVVPAMVSVIVPTHGRRKLLSRLLRSLQAQSWPADRFEVIVVHNHTDDGTDRAVAEIASASQLPIIYHRVDYNGPGPSRQFGAERAQGDVLAFIDDDCEATAGWIRAGVAALADGAALAQGRTLPHPDQPRRLMERTISVTGPTPYFETCNIFYRAEAFREVGGFPPEFRNYFGGEDTALGWAIKRAGYRTVFAADALVHHEVFAISWRGWMLEPWRNLRHWPFLARAFPALRRHLFLGMFLSPLTAAFDLALVGLIATIVLHPAGLVLMLPYLGLRFVERGRFRAPHILLARLIFGIPRAFVTLIALVSGSLRARWLVL